MTNKSKPKSTPLCSKCKKDLHTEGSWWCTACKNAKSCAWREAYPEKEAWLTYRGNAKRQGRDFTLTRERFNSLIFGYCFYSGHSPNPINGIDRVDNSLGYVEGNVVTCCHICNVAKRTLTQETFIRWLDDVARFRRE